jgi:hypothetical protein
MSSPDGKGEDGVASNPSIGCSNESSWFGFMRTLLAS